MSTISRRLGSGGKMYVPRHRYSFTMSFCVVPRKLRRGDAVLLGVGRRRARAATPRCALMVIDVFISPGRDAVEQRPHVAEVGDRHADLADLAPRQRVVGVVAGLGREVEGDRQPGLALGQVGAVELVRGRGRRVPRVRPHHPRLVAMREVWSLDSFDVQAFSDRGPNRAEGHSTHSPRIVGAQRVWTTAPGSQGPRHDPHPPAPGLGVRWI